MRSEKAGGEAEEGATNCQFVVQSLKKRKCIIGNGHRALDGIRYQAQALKPRLYDIPTMYCLAVCAA